MISNALEVARSSVPATEYARRRLLGEEGRFEAGSEVADDCSTFAPRFLLFEEDYTMRCVELLAESPWVGSTYAGGERLCEKLVKLLGSEIW